MEIKIKEEFLRQPVEWFGAPKETLEFLHTHGIETVEDVIDYQDNIPTEMFEPLKMTMMCRTLGIPEPPKGKGK